MLQPFGWGSSRIATPVDYDSPQDFLHPGWPESTPRVVLAGGKSVRLRPILRKDSRDWREMRLLDEPYLRPVEPTVPTSWEEAHCKSAWYRHFFFLRAAALRGDIVPFAIEVDGDFSGQLTLGNIQHGAIRECWIGYWVFSQLQGEGVATAACALGVDHAFGRVGLHRVTATYMPENPASGAVLRKCGFVEEGLLHRNLHIDGAWRNHLLMALIREDYSLTTVERLQKLGKLLPE